MPAAPDPHGIAVMLLAVTALFLFSRDRIPMETSALVVLGVLIVGFELFPYTAPSGQIVSTATFLAGFGNMALITIMALLMCTRSLEATGALQPVADRLAKMWLRSPTTALLAALLLAGTLSMFLNNTPVVAMLLPILVSVALRTGTPASSVLMPVGYATIVGGVCTTIGTSTNLLVVQISAEMGLAPMGMFHFTGVAVPAALLAIFYLWLVAPRLVPDRTPPLPDTSPRVFEAILHVDEQSAAAGCTIPELVTRTEGALRLGGIERGPGLFVARLPSVKIRPGDRLHVRDTPERLKRFEHQLGVKLYDALDPSHALAADEAPRAGDQRMAEIVVTRGSPLHRRTLKSVPFFAHHGLLPVAVHRPRSRGAEVSDIGDVFLRAGDIVLVQGSAASLDAVKRTGNVLVVDGSLGLPHTSKAPVAASIMVAVVLAAAFGVLSITVAALLGVLAMLVTNCLNWRTALGALDRRLIIVIVASLALGRALTVTGGMEYIASLFVMAAEPWPTVVALAGLMLVIALLTEVVTNNAAAVLGTPVAVFVAERLGVPAEPFVLAVLFGANMSYLTPIGYQTNLMVLSAGGYRFTDFFRVGLPLQQIMWWSLTILLAFRYDLF
ncbi:SLC13 family permease [Wenzhouxiangella sp. XN24]|uniref:SLC13 family permease n=1 Tax=Wenzhouxiangella sp. XN24 TaxID=2713569 RepID=UPI0013EC9C6E|nr:SLC13 family permease [Wenzhouxiangella sp. XN24]NGX17224.1 SLC13 family permease [Wenzhouxiangella sp. XN24]